MNRKEKDFCIEIFERPMAKQRPRFVHGHVYTPRATKEYEALICSEFTKRYGVPKVKGPIFIETVFKFRIPKTDKEHKEGDYYLHCPDLDNLQKAVLDALNGIAWEDDKQVVFTRAKKIYSEYDGIEIHIIELGG